MLKFKLTTQRGKTDIKTLEITDYSYSDGIAYEVPEGDVDNIVEIDDERTYTFRVADLYGLQSNSHISAISRVVVGDETNGDRQTFTYIEDLVVNNASKVDNSLSVRVKKEFEIPINNVYVETKYHAIYFYENRWQISLVDKKWIEAESENYDDVVWVEKEGMYGNNPYHIALYGTNKRPTYEGGKTQISDNTVFYYENDDWKSVDLRGNTLEGCLKGGLISFNSFHNYDSLERTPIRLLESNLYITSETYLYFEAQTTHYFSTPEETYSGNFTDKYRSIVETINYPVVYFYIEKYEGTSLKTVKIEKECHLENITTFSINYDLFNTNDGENDWLIKNENWQTITNEIYNALPQESREKCHLNTVYPLVEETVEKTLTLEEMLATDETKEKKYRRLTEDEITIFENTIFPYGYEIDDEDDVQLQYGTISDLVFKRENFVLNNKYSSYYLTYDTAVNVVQIPISQKFETDLHHNDLLKTNFVDDEKAKAINPIVDMEKDIYTPAISKEVKKGNEQINSDYIDCFKIIFNLHFLKHRDGVSKNGTRQEWVCDKNSLWNGIDEEDMLLRPKIDESEDTEKRGYFSYFPVGDYSQYQSDLLSYLGFVNDDVKYQKSKLKKSFLRISFYDSENVGNQNLLHTATIFFDSGNLFAKYIKNIETIDANNNGIGMAIVGGSSSSDSAKISYGNNGVRINREPQRGGTECPVLTDIGLGDDIDNLEELRLSSQFVVTDKYSSKRSSEGFYFYNYKTNDNGVYPSDIYMRVEFNHAGYGRTIPFMMPYVRENEIKDGKYDVEHIKSFQEILDDWKDEGYGPVKYLKYSHIKWKYRYDKDTQKHIYYLDPEVYGNSVISTNGHGNNIILNLYEGKIR